MSTEERLIDLDLYRETYFIFSLIQVGGVSGEASTSAQTETGTSRVIVKAAATEIVSAQTDVGSIGAPATNAVAPTISNIIPTPGTELERTDPIQFDVTDDQDDFRRVVPMLVDGGQWLVVHDGDVFSPEFSAGSTRSVIANGFRYVVVRQGGWRGPSGIRLKLSAIDTSGNEAS